MTRHHQGVDSRGHAGVIGGGRDRPTERSGQGQERLGHRSVTDDVQGAGVRHGASIVRRTVVPEGSGLLEGKRGGAGGLQAETLQPRCHHVGGQLEALDQLVERQTELDAVAQLLVGLGGPGVAASDRSAG